MTEESERDHDKTRRDNEQCLVQKQRKQNHKFVCLLVFSCCLCKRGTKRKQKKQNLHIFNHSKTKIQNFRPLFELFLSVLFENCFFSLILLFCFELLERA